MDSPITDPNEVLLNPEYLKKLREEEKRKKLESDIQDYVEDWNADSFKDIDSDFLRNLVDFLATPMPYDPDHQPMSVTEEAPPVEWKVEVPVVNVKF